MNLERFLRRKFQPEPTPQAAVIRWKAHAATLACAALIIPSLCAIYFRQAGLKEEEPYWVWAASTVWKIHIGVALLAVFFWLTEKPRLTKYQPDHLDDDDSVQEPNQPTQPIPPRRDG